MNKSIKIAILLFQISVSLPMFGAASSSSAAASSVVARAVSGSAGVRAVQRQKDHIDLSGVSPEVSQVIEHLQELVATKKDSLLVAITHDRMQDFANEQLHEAYQAVQKHSILLPAVSAAVLHQYKKNKKTQALADDKGKGKASDIEDVIDEMSEHAQDAHLWQVELQDDWVTLTHQLTGEQTAWKAELFAQSQTLLDAAGVDTADDKAFKKSLPDALSVALRNYSHDNVALLMRALNCAYGKDEQKLKDFVEGLSSEQVNWLYEKANQFDIPVLQTVCCEVKAQTLEGYDDLPLELQEEMRRLIDIDALDDAMMKLAKAEDLNIQLEDEEYIHEAYYIRAEDAVVINTGLRILIYGLVDGQIVDVGFVRKPGEYDLSAFYNSAGNAIVIYSSRRVFIYYLKDRELIDTDFRLRRFGYDDIQQVRFSRDGDQLLIRTNSTDNIYVLADRRLIKNIISRFNFESNSAERKSIRWKINDDCLITNECRILICSVAGEPVINTGIYLGAGDEQAIETGIVLQDNESVELVTYKDAESPILIITSKRVLLYKLADGELVDTGAVLQDEERFWCALFNSVEDAIVISTGSRILIYSLVSGQLVDIGGFCWQREEGCFLFARFINSSEDAVFTYTRRRVLIKSISCKQLLHSLEFDQLKFLIQKVLPSWCSGCAYVVSKDEQEIYESLPVELQRPEFFRVQPLTLALINRFNSTPLFSGKLGNLLKYLSQYFVQFYHVKTP